MREYSYLLFNLVILLPPFLLSIFSDVKTYKNWRGLLAGFLLVSLPFVLWDIWAASNSHWLFSSVFITSPRIFGIPFEEILFFVSIPFAMCFVWDVLAKHIPSKPVSEVVSATAVVLIALSAILLLLLQWDKGYTRSAALATLIAVLVVLASGWWRRNRFWWFQAILIAVFLLANTLLTALPVITYGQNSFNGFRVGTIPIEDFFFNFTLITIFVLTYDYVQRKYNNTV